MDKLAFVGDPNEEVYLVIRPRKNRLGCLFCSGYSCDGKSIEWSLDIDQALLRTVRQWQDIAELHWEVIGSHHITVNPKTHYLDIRRIRGPRRKDA